MDRDGDRGSMSEPNDNGLFILRCPDGHEWMEQLTLPMNLTAAAKRMKAMDYCTRCSKKGAVILQGEERQAVKKLLLAEKA